MNCPMSFNRTNAIFSCDHIQTTTCSHGAGLFFTILRHRHCHTTSGLKAKGVLK